MEENSGYKGSSALSHAVHRRLDRWLTNQKLYERFENTFDLVAYAIRVAEGKVRSGREANVHTDVKNIAHQILEEILNEKELILSEEEIASIRETLRQEVASRQQVIDQARQQAEG